MTEKCVKFTKTHLSISNASDVTTLSDLLTTKSVGNVLESIKRLKQSTEGSVRGISTAHSAFFVKVFNLESPFYKNTDMVYIIGYPICWIFRSHHDRPTSLLKSEQKNIYAGESDIRTFG